MAEAHGQEVEAGAEHQHAIGLGDHAPRRRMRERTDDAEIAGMAAEHVLAARRGGQQRAGPLGQRSERRLGAGAVRAEAGQDHRLAALPQDGDGRLDRLRLRRGGRAGPLGAGAVADCGQTMSASWTLTGSSSAAAPPCSAAAAASASAPRAAAGLVAVKHGCRRRPARLRIERLVVGADRLASPDGAAASPEMISTCEPERLA